MAPSLVRSLLIQNATRDGVALTTGAFTPTAGNILILKFCAEDAAAFPSTPAPTSSGSSFSWTNRNNSSLAANNEAGFIFSSVVPASPVSSTVSCNATSSGWYKAMVLEEWANAQLAASPAVNATKNGASGAMQASITMGAANGVASMMFGDWNVNAGARTYLNSANTTEEGQALKSGAFVGTFAYTNVAAAGAITVGTSAPVAAGAWFFLGIEIQDLVAAGPTLEKVPPRNRARFRASLW